MVSDVEEKKERSLTERAVPYGKELEERGKAYGKKLKKGYGNIMAARAKRKKEEREHRAELNEKVKTEGRKVYDEAYLEEAKELAKRNCLRSSSPPASIILRNSS